MFRSNHNRLVKRNRGKDKDEKEDDPTFMITTVAAVREVCVVEGGRAKEWSKAEDEVKR